jgi:haloalkane dehalogenase
MNVLRTPDERFVDLAGFDFAPHYVELPELRIHYLDEGPRDAAETVVLMHGEPSWCYLYRKMIPPLVAAGHRVLAPDLVGFGRSDKPASPDDYSYQRHVDWMLAWVRALDLGGVTLFGQDWGGLIGLRLVPLEPGRYRRVVAANTFLPTGNEPTNESFLKWREFSQRTPVFDVARVLQGATVETLPPEVLAAYDAPFPDESFKAGARQFPTLVPISPEDPAAAANKAAWEFWFKSELPFLTAFSDSDPITRGGDIFFRRVVPGTRGQPHTTIAKAGHFLQEDRGEELARVVVDFIAQTPVT